MANLTDLANAYQYLLGRSMNLQELHSFGEAEVARLSETSSTAIRLEIIRSPEFINQIKEIIWPSIVPTPIIIRFELRYGASIFLDLRQLHVSWGILYGSYERDEIDFILALLSNDALFVDVGANVGYYSLMVASKPGFSGRVIAFEPLAAARDLFERSIVSNGFERKVTVFPTALAHAGGEVELVFDKETLNFGGTHLNLGAQSAREGDRVYERITMESLDAFSVTEANFRPDAIKVDIEGAEGLFLRGSERTLELHRPVLLAEINKEQLYKVSGWTLENAFAWFEARRYHLAIPRCGPLKFYSTADALVESLPETGIMNIAAIPVEKAETVSKRLE